MIHTCSIESKLKEAHDTLFMAQNYMDNLGREFENLRKKEMSDRQVREYIEILLPLDEDATTIQKRNMAKLRDDLSARYFDAPDLKEIGRNAYRFINAVSDFATHADPIRRTENYRENLFARTIDGNPLIDKAYQMVCAA